MLEVQIDGIANTYQWYLDGIEIEGLTSKTIELSDSGTYKCIVKNTKLPDLTVESEEFIVD